MFINDISSFHVDHVSTLQLLNVHSIQLSTIAHSQDLIGLTPEDLGWNTLGYTTEVLTLLAPAMKCPRQLHQRFSHSIETLVLQQVCYHLPTDHLLIGKQLNS